MLIRYLTEFWQTLLKDTLFIIAFCYVLRILIVVLCKWKRAAIPGDDGALFAFRSITFLTLFAWNCGLNGYLDLSEYLCQAVSTLFFCMACSILEWILRYGGVCRMIDDLIEYFLVTVERARSFFQKISEFLCLHTALMYLVLAFLFVGTPLVGTKPVGSKFYAGIYTGWFYSVLCVFGLCAALVSPSAAFAFWFCLFIRMASSDGNRGIFQFSGWRVCFFCCGNCICLSLDIYCPCGRIRAGANGVQDHKYLYNACCHCRKYSHSCSFHRTVFR